MNRSFYSDIVVIRYTEILSYSDAFVFSLVERGTCSVGSQRLSYDRQQRQLEVLVTKAHRGKTSKDKYHIYCCMYKTKKQSIAGD